MTRYAKKQKVLHNRGKSNNENMPQNYTEDIINRQDIKAIIITIFLMFKKVEVENVKKTYERYKNAIGQTSRYLNIQWVE